MKRIIVFGSTGGIGRQVVSRALAAGHMVTAVARTPSALAIEHERLRVVRGDLLSPGTFAGAMEGHDAVVSTIGTPSREATTLYSAGIGNIMGAMEGAGVRRLIAVSASAIVVSPKLGIPLRLLTRHVVQRLLRKPYEDTRLMESIIRSSRLDWTIMRPPRLTDGPATGAYRVAINDFLTNPTNISRADLAAYIVGHLFDAATYRATIEIAR